MVGTFRLLPVTGAGDDIRAWAHGVPSAKAAAHRMVPFWYPSITIWREWSDFGEVAQVHLRLHGPQPSRYFYAPRKPVELIGIAVAPELAQHALGISNDDCSGQFINWNENGFEEALILARSGAEAAFIAEAMARQILILCADVPKDRVYHAVRMMRRLQGTGALGIIRGRVGFSERPFRTAFKSRIGVTAKEYSRLLRVNAIIGRADQASNPNWADLAHRYGYFDQAHMINDLRRLTGLPPTMLDAERRAE